MLGEWGTAPRVFNLGTRWRWVVSFTPGERASGILWIGGLVRTGSDLDTAVAKKKSHHCPCRELNRGRPAPSLVTILIELPRLIFRNK
jgi:hypothetical protein